MNAVGDDADGGTVQPHEAGPLFTIAFESSDSQVLFCAFRFKSPSESAAKRDINNGSAHGLTDLLRTKVVTTRSSLEPILQQAQTDADNFLVVLIHQLTKE